MIEKHCVKSVHIPSFSGPYFPAFGLNTERYSVSLRIQSECGKIRTKKTPNTDTFNAMKFCGIDCINKKYPTKFFVIFLVIFFFYQIFFISHYSFLKITSTFIHIMIKCHSLSLPTHLKQILASWRN